MIDSISTPATFIFPITSVILPSGFLPDCSGLVICTTTLSLSFAPLKYFFEINISLLSFLLSGTTNPKLLLFLKVPTIVSISLTEYLFLLFLVILPSCSILFNICFNSSMFDFWTLKIMANSLAFIGT